MSRRYPGQDAQKNKKINRLSQQYSYTGEYCYRREEQRLREEGEAKRAAFKLRDPDGYEKKQAAKESKAQSVSPQDDSRKDRAVVGAGGSVATLGFTEVVTGAFAGAGTAAAAGGIGLVVVGLGTAAAINSTLLKDEPTASESERSSRAVGRVGTYSGGALGTLGTVGMIGASGSVAGLSTAGIASGVAAIGATVGGGAIAGSLIVVALPALAATAIGYGAYKLFQWTRE